MKADGVELNTWLVQYSRLSSLYNGVFGQTKFYKRDLWKFDVSPYKYIVIFGVEQMVNIRPLILRSRISIFRSLFQMNDLERKLLEEAREDSKIIACRFPLPNMKANRIVGEGIDTVWLYELRKTQNA